MKNEIIIYQNEDSATKIEVRLEDETVWLTQNQIVEIFESSKQILANILKILLKQKN
jgi:hypothetical protein